MNRIDVPTGNAYTYYFLYLAQSLWLKTQL